MPTNDPNKHRSECRKYREANREKCRESQSKYASTVDGKIKIYKRKNIWLQNKRKEYKHLVFSFYGNKCSCCGEKEPLFLTIDHINNDGSQHRRKIGKRGDAIYRWIVKNDFPGEFQILCMNCNWGKFRNNGECPHKTKCAYR